MKISTASQKTILFDGVCNFCNASVNFILRHDKKNLFLFSSLQSEKAKKLLLEHSIHASSVDSLVYLEDQKVYLKSTAVLKIARQLGGLYPFLYGFIILPRFVRDQIYDFIARNRYRWWGKREVCRVPTEAEKGRFIF